ncbi:uncharacterized protein LOC126979262 isoform X3 [Leptidea sinapis]|uniref:Cathepsin propeptide inhibitor domain-containing protein n=1 Tax=Leptidea sinapis TaxID=189913 RepID=A0A5E4QHC1_9NEOP|nr:uncharacterized protein LOC126979262 isoform X2 [Leptidea sinapis]XP_050684501.1 uncharacterized protein LOC126979262 isoform X3 [Leptidea sinapis]VVC96685.1 unnamed protein product [Leptidea sinapis]
MATGRSLSEKPHYKLEDAPQLFEKFIKDYDRKYANDEDRKIHYDAFVRSLEKINKANASNTATFDINKFADYTPEESKHLFGLSKRT